MSKRLFSGMVAALALTPAALLANDPPKPAAPPPELAQLAYFEGIWNCTGKTFASPMGPEHATTATVHGDKAVGGMWVHITYDEKKTAANPAPYHAGVYMGYDAAKKNFVFGCVDNFGGYCNESGTGWNGDTMVLEGTANGTGHPVPGRDTFVKKGPSELMHAGEMQDDNKQWAKTDEETCRKGK